MGFGQHVSMYVSNRGKGNKQFHHIRENLYVALLLLVFVLAIEVFVGCAKNTASQCRDTCNHTDSRLPTCIICLPTEVLRSKAGRCHSFEEKHNICVARVFSLYMVLRSMMVVRCCLSSLHVSLLMPTSTQAHDMTATNKRVESPEGCMST